MNDKAKNILIVEDESDIREIIKDVCVSLGHSAIQAKDGSEGFFKFKNQNFDMIITDLQMPKSSGVDLIKAVRGSEKNTLPVPILVVSGNTAEFEPQLALFKGIYSISKPFKTDIFQQTINKAFLESVEKTTTTSNYQETLFLEISNKCVELFKMITKSEVGLDEMSEDRGPKVFEGSYFFSQSMYVKKQFLQFGLVYESTLAKYTAKALAKKTENCDIRDDEVYRFLSQLLQVISAKVKGSSKALRLPLEFGPIDSFSIGAEGLQGQSFLDKGLMIKSVKLNTLKGKVSVYFSFPTA